MVQQKIQAMYIWRLSMGNIFQGIEIEWDECITSWLVFYVMPKLVIKRTHSEETPNLI